LLSLLKLFISVFLGQIPTLRDGTLDQKRDTREREDRDVMQRVKD